MENSNSYYSGGDNQSPMRDLLFILLLLALLFITKLCV